MTIKAQLPKDTAERLVHSRSDTSAFHSLVLALRARGWTLRAIAEPFEASRVSAKNWETAASANQEAVAKATTLIQSVPAPPLDGHGAGLRKMRIKADIPPRDRERIKEIAPLAAKNTRWSATTSPQRLASLELDDLIVKYVLQRRVPAATFARYAGVTRRAIIQRAEKRTTKE